MADDTRETGISDMLQEETGKEATNARSIAKRALPLITEKLIDIALFCKDKPSVQLAACQFLYDRAMGIVDSEADRPSNMLTDKEIEEWINEAKEEIAESIESGKN